MIGASVGHGGKATKEVVPFAWRYGGTDPVRGACDQWWVGVQKSGIEDLGTELRNQCGHCMELWNDLLCVEKQIGQRGFQDLADVEAGALCRRTPPHKRILDLIFWVLENHWRALSLEMTLTCSSGKIPVAEYACVLSCFSLVQLLAA